MLPKNHNGFSLIEALIVVGLIALLSTLVMANFSFFNRNLLHDEINKLYSSCMYLQRMAMTTNTIQTLTFDKRQRKYSFNGRIETLPRDLEFSFSSGLKGPPSSPTHIINTAITFKNNQIVFNPNGIIQPGSVYLTDTSKQQTYALSSPISQVSFLRKYRYDNKWGLID